MLDDLEQKNSMFGKITILKYAVEKNSRCGKSKQKVTAVIRTEAAMG